MKITLAYAADDEEVMGEEDAGGEDLENMSKEEMMEHAKKMGIEVNPSMDENDLKRAIKNAKGR